MIHELNTTNSDQGQRVAFKVLDAIQREPQGTQVAGVSLMFLMMCKRFNVSPRDVLDKTDRILHDAFKEGRGEYIRAIRDYTQGEF